MIFFILIRTLFNRFIRKYGYEIKRRQIFATLHGKLLVRFSIVSIALYALFIYLFDLKFYILRIPLLKETNFTVNLFGILVFFILLGIIWICSFPSYQRFYNSTTSLKSYLLSHLRLNGAIITPWLFFSIILDIIRLLPSRVVETVENNPYINYSFFAIFLITIVCFFPWLLVKIWNCETMPSGNIRKVLEDFCKQAGFKYSDILVWNLFDGKIITAGVIGMIKKIRYLFISPTLLEILSYDELKSVIAHEIGHIKSRHMIFYVFFILGYAVFAYAFFNIINFGMLSQDIILDSFLKQDGSIQTGFYIIPVMALIIFLLLYFRFFFGVFSRNFERQSDLYAIKMLGNGEGIISSLEKIAKIGSHNRTASNWHHYSIQERIDFVKKCEEDHRLIKKHDRKVAKIIASYFIALVIIVGFFYRFNTAIINEPELNFIQKILEKRLETDYKNPDLHFMLANLYYEKKLFEKAEKEYLATLAIKTDAPEALNNLAWLYATSEDIKLRKPQEALKLALKAVRLNPKPYILDTLAESYFINGLYKEAVETSKLAIAQNPKDMSHHKKQLKRFEEHLRKEQEKRKRLSEGTYISI